MLKLLVILPAYNEGQCIRPVLAEIVRQQPHADLLVVNDGSIDDTVTAALQAGALVADLPHNLGIGGAMQTGFRYAKAHGYDVAVQVDADGQHPADQIQLLLNEMERSGVDLVIGSRFVEATGYRASLTRGVGIRFFARLLSALCHQRLTDTTSGFRAANRAAIAHLADNYACDYPEVESLISLHRAGYRICEVPVRMLPRQAGTSSISPLRSVYYMMKVAFAVLVGALSDARPPLAEDRPSTTPEAEA